MLQLHAKSKYRARNGSFSQPIDFGASLSLPAKPVIRSPVDCINYIYELVPVCFLLISRPRLCSTGRNRHL